MDTSPIIVLFLAIGCGLTLLLLAVVAIWELGRVVKRQVFATRGRFRLRTPAVLRCAKLLQ